MVVDQKGTQEVLQYPDAGKAEEKDEFYGGVLHLAFDDTDIIDAQQQEYKRDEDKPIIVGLQQVFGFFAVLESNVVNQYNDADNTEQGQQVTRAFSNLF